MSDFIEKEVDIEVNGKIFRIRTLNGAEEDEILTNSFDVNEDERIKPNIQKKNQGYLKCVVEAPYPEWEKLPNLEERIKFLQELKGYIRKPLIRKIIEHHNKEDEIVKK